MTRTSKLVQVVLFISMIIVGPSCGNKTHDHVSDFITEESKPFALIEVSQPEEPALNTFQPWSVKQVYCERYEQTQRQQQANCEVEHGSGKGLVLIGRVLTPDVVFENGVVAVDDKGLIRYVGCHDSKIQAARIVHCQNHLISPGLINAHDHLAWTNEAPANWGDTRYSHRHDWRIGTQGGPKLNTSKKIKNVLVEWGELRQLMHGTTSIAGSSKADGFLRNIDVLDEMQPEDQDQKSSDSDLRFYPGLINESFPLGDSGGHLQSETCYFSYLFNPASLQKSSSSLMLHVAEGIDKFARNEFLCLSGARQKAIDIIDQKTVLVHAIGLSAQEVKKVKERGASIVWSPRSNISLYGQTTPVSLYRNLGVPIAIGSDWMPSGSSTLNREMTCALDYSRDYLQGMFSPRDIWLMTTAHAASVFGKSGMIGELRKGLLADISIYQGSSDVSQDPFSQIIQAEAKDLLAVFKNGRFLYGADHIVDKLGVEYSNGPCQAIPGSVCGNQNRLCGVLETKIPLADLFAQHEKSYPLFSCDAKPPDEPTCLPARPGEYSGIKTKEDADGDGVLNPSDNCPLLFNPKRPVDGFLQTDSDFDGQGDECDLCPFDASNQCTSSFKIDTDHDGIENKYDNCPFDVNPLQKDRDGDGIGDACDACADFANADGICPATISEINHQKYPNGTKVRINAQVAFAEPMASNAKKQSFYLSDLGNQELPMPEFGGLFVYKARGTFKAGDELEVIGVVNPYWGQMQIWPLRIDVKKSHNEDQGSFDLQALPISYGDLPSFEAASSGLRYLWESRLVSLETGNLTKDENGNFYLGGQLQIDVSFAKIKTKSLCLNSSYKITGFLSLGEESWIIRPRNLDDFIALEETCKSPL